MAGVGCNFPNPTFVLLIFPPLYDAHLFVFLQENESTERMLPHSLATTDHNKAHDNPSLKGSGPLQDTVLSE